MPENIQFQHVFSLVYPSVCNTIILEGICGSKLKLVSTLRKFTLDLHDIEVQIHISIHFQT